MKFVAHPNFLVPAIELLKTYDGGSEFAAFPYQPGTPDPEWMPCLAKERPRPFVIGFSCDMVRNRVQRQMFHESGCNYVLFGKAWEDAPWPEFGWRLLKVWTDVLTQARRATRPTILDVTLNGKVTRMRTQ